MTAEVKKLWGEELLWIQNDVLRDKTAAVWALALEKSVLSADDLLQIPFTLLVPVNVSFMAHKVSVVHISRDAGTHINKFYGNDLPVNMDVLIAGAILADVGKLLEYELDADGKAIQSNYGKYVRHPFSGVSLAEACGMPPEVCHIIAAHADEGNLIKRSTEAYIVHHSDFMTFLPFKSGLKI